MGQLLGQLTNFLVEIVDLLVLLPDLGRKPLNLSIKILDIPFKPLSLQIFLFLHHIPLQLILLNLNLRIHMAFLLQ